MPDLSIRQLRLYSLIAAIGAVIVSPLLALSYFATAEGADQLDEVVYRGGVEPARDAVGGLVTFDSPDTVYAVYTLVLAFLFPAIILAAFATRDQRSDGTLVELWGWRITLTGYALFGAGLPVVAMLLLLLGSDSTLVNVIFLSIMIPGLLVGLIGSTILGVAVLRSGSSTPWRLVARVGHSTVVRRERRSWSQQPGTDPSVRGVGGGDEKRASRRSISAMKKTSPEVAQRYRNVRVTRAA